jgi:hypothetical protein
MQRKTWSSVATAKKIAQRLGRPIGVTRQECADTWFVYIGMKLQYKRSEQLQAFVVHEPLDMVPVLIGLQGYLAIAAKH